MAFILTLRERGHSWAGRGPFTTEHPTEQDAQAALAEYVRDTWAVEMDGDEVPDDEQEMIRQYFDHVLAAYDISEIG